MKRMNTQIASWAQLRHDNLLYVAPVYDFTCGCSYPGIINLLLISFFNIFTVIMSFFSFLLLIIILKLDLWSLWWSFGKKWNSCVCLCAASCNSLPFPSRNQSFSSFSSFHLLIMINIIIIVEREATAKEKKTRKTIKRNSLQHLPNT